MLEIKKPIYIFNWVYEEECGWGYNEPLRKAQYTSITGLSCCAVKEEAMESYEKGCIIFRATRYVHDWDIRTIYKEEIKKPDNKTEEDLIKAVNKRIKRLNIVKNPKYKEKQLLKKINTLYSKVKGELIKDEILYNGKFLKTIKETYLLPNNKTVEKEKIVKNNGKDAVIIIPKIDGIGMDSNYIITFQQRINGEILAEFPSGYIEENESPMEAAKRELEEETGYTSKDISIIEEAYTSPGIDNSKTYIVFAASCEKTNTTKKNQTELLSAGLFSKRELEYLVGNNIMNGALNKLVYYTLTSDSKPRKTLKP